MKRDGKMIWLSLFLGGQLEHILVQTGTLGKSYVNGQCLGVND